MARRHPRTPLSEPPEALRLDIRPASAHPLLRLWAFRRPFVAGQAIKEALEGVLRREGEEGLDRLLAALAKGIEEVPATAPPAPYKREPAPQISETPPESSPAIPPPDTAAVQAPAQVEAVMPAATPPAAPQEPEPASEAAAAETAADKASEAAPELQTLAAPTAAPGVEAIPQREADAPQATAAPQPAVRQSSPVEALATLGTDALRERQNRNMAALLQNAEIFK